MQGKSLLPLLTGAGTPFREDWFYEHNFGSTRHRIERTQGVRTRRWKMIRYVGQRPSYVQLFDLEADPFETQNVALLPAHRDTLAHLKSKWMFYRRTLE